MPRVRKSQKVALYHERLADTFQLSVSLLVPAMAIICGWLARIGILDSGFYLSDGIYFGLSFAYILTSALFFYTRATGRFTTVAKVLCIGFFNIITLLFTYMLTGYASVFLVAWMPLMVSSDLYFGRLGFFLSFVAFATSGVLTLISYPHLQAFPQYVILTEVLLAITTFGVVTAIIRRITESEGRVLVQLSEEEDLERERLRALINSMGDAVVTTDESGSIKVYNAALLSLLDTNANLTGKSIDRVLHLHDHGKKKILIMHEARAVRKLFSRTDLTHSFSDGQSIRLYVNVAPIKPGYQSRGERGFIFILRDITKEKTLEEERDEFISVVSHELRTPVAIVEGNLSNVIVLRQRGASEATLDHALDDAHRQTLYLAKMINDLGTLSRAERGVASEAEEINLRELFGRLYKTYLPQAEQKSLHLNLDVGPKTPTIFTSRLYLEEIMQNLITNAIKYTDKGSVTLGAHRKQDAILITIKDTGIGIGKSDIPHIFEKFYRSEDYRTRESSGTGLGLYISKKLADKLGFELTFESRLNHGTTFTLHIKQRDARR